MHARIWPASIYNNVSFVLLLPSAAASALASCFNRCPLQLLASRGSSWLLPVGCRSNAATPARATPVAANIAMPDLRGEETPREVVNAHLIPAPRRGECFTFSGRARAEVQRPRRNSAAPMAQARGLKSIARTQACRQPATLRQGAPRRNRFLRTPDFRSRSPGSSRRNCQLNAGFSPLFFCTKLPSRLNSCLLQPQPPPRA